MPKKIIIDTNLLLTATAKGKEFHTGTGSEELNKNHEWDLEHTKNIDAAKIRGYLVHICNQKDTEVIIDEMVAREFIKIYNKNKNKEDKKGNSYMSKLSKTLCENLINTFYIKGILKQHEPLISQRNENPLTFTYMSFISHSIKCDINKLGIDTIKSVPRNQRNSITKFFIKYMKVPGWKNNQQKQTNLALAIKTNNWEKIGYSKEDTQAINRYTNACTSLEKSPNPEVFSIIKNLEKKVEIVDQAKNVFRNIDMEVDTYLLMKYRNQPNTHIASNDKDLIIFSKYAKSMKPPVIQPINQNIENLVTSKTRNELFKAIKKIKTSPQK